MPTPSWWAEAELPPWSQLRRRLREDADVRRLLAAELGRHRATSGRLTGLARYDPPMPSNSTWFSGRWHPGGADVLVADVRVADVLVKVNVTELERFWMSAASSATTGVVAPVFADGTGLGPVDAAWLVLERLERRYDSSWGAAAFSALLEAAARFQAFAADVDTPLVYQEGIAVIRHWALGGRDLCPEAALLLRQLDRDWAWVASVAPAEVLFGDLHFGNAAFRRPPSRALLFDPIPRRHPWPFEPAYFEVLCGGSGLVREMAAIRAAQGRPVPGPADVDRLAALYCAWMALLWWGIQPELRTDAARRARLTGYVTAAARLDR